MFDGRRWEVGGRLVLVGVRLLFVVVVGTVVVVVVVPVAMTAPGRDLGPGDSGEDVERFQAALATWGYDLVADGHYGPVTAAVVTALQRHFRQARCDGRADHETRAMLAGLLAAAQHRAR